MAELTRQISPASPVGTEVAATTVVDNSAAKFLQNVSTIATKAVQQQDVIISQDARSAVDTTVEELDEERNIASIENTIDGELRPVATLGRGVKQGRANSDRFTTELDARVRKLKVQFPGHTDIIDKRVRHLVGFDPRQATRDIAFRESAQEIDELKQLVSLGVQNGLVVFNDSRIGAASGVNEVSTANAASRFLESQRLSESSAKKLATERARGNNGGASEAVFQLQQALETQFQEPMTNLVNALFAFDVAGASTEEQLGFINAAQDQMGRMSAAASQSMAGMEPDDIKAVESFIQSKFNFINSRLGEGAIGLSVLQQTAKIVEDLKASGQLMSITDMETITILTDVWGENVGAVTGALLLDEQIRTKVQKLVGEETRTLLEAAGQEGGNIRPARVAQGQRIAIISDVILSGKYGAASPHLNDSDRAQITEDSWQAAKDFGTRLLEEKEIPVWGNTWVALNDNYRDFLQDDPDNVVNLVKALDSPTFRANLLTLEKVQPSRATSVKEFASNILRDSAIMVLNPKGNFLTTSANISAQLKVIEFDEEAGVFVDRLAGTTGVVPSRVREALPVLNTHLKLIRSLGFDEKVWIASIGIEKDEQDGELDRQAD